MKMRRESCWNVQRRSFLLCVPMSAVLHTSGAAISPIDFSQGVFLSLIGAEILTILQIVKRRTSLHASLSGKIFHAPVYCSLLIFFFWKLSSIRFTPITFLNLLFVIEILLYGPQYSFTLKSAKSTVSIHFQWPRWQIPNQHCYYF